MKKRFHFDFDAAKLRKKKKLTREQKRKIEQELEMPVEGRSTLLNQTGILIGFGYEDNPSDPKEIILISFWRLTTGKIVICFQTVKSRNEADLQRVFKVPIKGSDGFAFTAERSIEGATIESFKQIIMESFPDVSFTWDE